MNHTINNEVDNDTSKNTNLEVRENRPKQTETSVFKTFEFKTLPKEISSNRGMKINFHWFQLLLDKNLTLDNYLYPLLSFSASLMVLLVLSCSIFLSTLMSSYILSNFFMHFNPGARLPH